MKLTTLDQALRVTPRDAVLWLRLGDYLSAHGQRDQAREAYRRAAVLRPHCLIPRLKLRRLTHPSPKLRDVFNAAWASKALWEEGWLDPDWEDDTPTTARAASREAETNPTVEPNPGRRAQVAHVRPTAAPPTLRTEGLELFGITVAAAATILVGSEGWSLYHTMIGGALLLLLTRHMRASSWLRREAAPGIASTVGLCLVLILGAPLSLLRAQQGGLSLAQPLVLEGALLLTWLVATLVLAFRLRR